MSHPPLGDVVVRARGLGRHLLEPATLRQLARASGIGVLAGALEDAGYWPAPTAAGPAASAARVVDRSIEHEIWKRLAVLERWLAERAGLFAALFELELRDALRIRLRELAAGARSGSPYGGERRGGWPALRDLRTVVARAGDRRELVRALERLRSPYAPPLAAVLRAHRDDPEDGDAALETALDRTWASRARATATRIGDPLTGWVEDEIDLHNAWGTLAGDTSGFLEGGRRLSRPLCDSIAVLEGEPSRRARIARAFRGGALAGVFDDPELGLESLEARARAARIDAARRSARLDPIGPSPILELVLRLWAERADLRCIGFGVWAGLPYETIVSRLVAAS